MRAPIESFNAASDNLVDFVKGFAPIEGIGQKILKQLSVSPLDRYSGINITEKLLSSTLGGSEAGAAAVSGALEAARKYPMKFDEILQAFRSLSVYPTVKPMMGDKKFQEDLLTAVSGLSLINPAQGVGGALFSTVEALSGS